MTLTNDGSFTVARAVIVAIAENRPDAALARLATLDADEYRAVTLTALAIATTLAVWADPGAPGDAIDAAITTLTTQGPDDVSPG